MSDETQWIAGLHSVKTALKHSSSAVTEVWFDDKRHDRRMKEIQQQVKHLGVKAVYVSKKEIEAQMPDVNHQGVIALTQVPSSGNGKQLIHFVEALDKPALLLILDGVTDPHNLGACLRSADGAGVDAVIAPKDRAVGLTPIACKVASGAAETMPFFQVTNLARCLKQLQEAGVWLVGTAGEAETSLFEVDLTGSLGLIMGAEGKGMRRLTRENCDQLIKLPMLGQVESLNVSVATGVCLYEAVRQRG